MDLDAYLRKSAGQINRALGAESVTITRNSTLEAVRGGLAPAELVAAGAAVAGAPIDLELPASSGLRGTLLAGSTVTIDDQLYEVTADAVAVDDRLAAVALSWDDDGVATPGLRFDVAAGAVVKITSGPRYTWPDAHVMEASLKDQGGSPGAELLMVVALPIEGAPTVPVAGDAIVRDQDGAAGVIVGHPLALDGSWDVRVNAK